MTIGERIKNRRVELGLSVEEVSQRLGKNRATVYRYENGFIEDMPTSVLESLARILLTTPADLMGWTDAQGAPEPSEPLPAARRALTAKEAEILRKYRALDAYQQARLEGYVDKMLEESKKESLRDRKIS